jgi:hypothetical protein
MCEVVGRTGLFTHTLVLSRQSRLAPSSSDENPCMFGYHVLATLLDASRVAMRRGALLAAVRRFGKDP